MKKYKLGIIGVGVMGQAILHCATEKKLLQEKDVALFDVCPDSLTPYRTCNFCAKNAQEVIDCCEYVLVSIKPQHFDELAKNIKIETDTVIISIMAGTPISKIRNKTHSTFGIARIMPNTPCRIGYGMCAVCFDNVPDDKKDFIFKLFDTCGKTLEIDEKYFDTITSVSGSGPAYVYSFINGMIKGGMGGGLTYEQSKFLTLQTFIGAMKMAENSTEPLGTLIDKVCSKGGTTIEAVKIFQENNLEQIIISGMDACRKRSEELSKNA